MFPSSSRVKLNRVALKDVIGLKPVPRRRRVLKSPDNFTADSSEREDNKLVPGPDSAKGLVCDPASDGPVQSLFKDRVGPGTVTDTADEGEPEEQKYVFPQKDEMRGDVESRRGIESMEFKREGPPCTGDIDRNTPPSSTGRTAPEAPLRRAVRASGCGICGCCKYVSPLRKRLGKHGQRKSNPEPERPMVKGKLKEEKRVTEKIIVWINQYPQVELCDIKKCLPNGDTFTKEYGYVLTDVLETKVVRCFKQDMRAGFQFGPAFFGHDTQESEKDVLAKNTEFCPKNKSEESTCQSQSLTDHQKHLKECTDAPRLSRTTTSEDAATCSASFLPGKRTKTVSECRTGMWDRDVEEDPGPGSPLVSSKIHTDKRIKLGDSVEGGMLPSTPDLDSIGCNDQAKMDSSYKEKTCSRISDDSQSCLEHGVGGPSTIGSAVTENCVHKEPCGEVDNLTETDAAHMSSELCSQREEVETDDLSEESFTCQRVRPYFRRILFSCARTYMPFSKRSSTRPAEPFDPSTGDNCDFPIEHKQQGLSSEQTNGVLPGAPTDPSADTTHHPNEANQPEDGDIILAERKIPDNMPPHSSDSKDMEFQSRLMEAEESLVSLPSPSNLSLRGGELNTDTVSASSLPINEPKSDSSASTPSPTALHLTDWESTTTLSTMSSPLTHGGLSSLPATPSFVPPSPFLVKTPKDVQSADTHSAGASPTTSSPNNTLKALEKAFFYSQETQVTLCHNSDSFHSCESSFLLPQDEQESDEECLAARFPPTLEPFYNTSPVNHNQVDVNKSSWHDDLPAKGVETDPMEFMLPPVLSPVASPPGGSQTYFLPPSLEDGQRQMLPQGVNSSDENSKDYLGNSSDDSESVSTNVSPLRELQSPPHSDSDYQEDVERVGNTSDCEPVPSDPHIKAGLPSAALTPCSCSSSNEDDGGALSDEGSRPDEEQEEDGSDLSDSEMDQTEAEVQKDILDEFSAYVQDILLVDVNNEDPELFESLPGESALKLGPTRVTEAPKARPNAVVKTLSPIAYGASQEFKQRLTPVYIDFNGDSPDCTDEMNSRPWRPRCRSPRPKTQSNTWPATEKQTKHMGQPDANNNNVKEDLKRDQPIQTVNSQNNSIPQLMTIKNGPRVINTVNVAEVRHPKCAAYCRQYFSESLSCGFKMCWFQHVPVEGDEKFCVETVMRFTKNPKCFRKAGEVFTGYYQNNPPGVYFSMHMLLTLCWALLKAGMVSDVFSVLNVSLAHEIVPDHEFLLALFNFVREKGLIGCVPELLQLTFKMASAGLVLSLDCLKNTPEFQLLLHPNSLVSLSGNPKLSTAAPEYLNLAHAIVEIELCSKQEDWRRMGEVFRSICQSSQRSNQLERISGRMAIALLSESKDKLSLPFAAFMETVCPNEVEDSHIRSFLGRIGVSLMLRYHKTQQWGKGRRVVEVLSFSKINYPTLKGLFGNEDGASRCYLVTVAAELFLLSGSLEGALNTLRDMESRTRVLIRLAERTSHRDTLEVLSNLPGLKEPNALVNISSYRPLFTSHLKVCVDRQTLPVASDTVDFMLSKKLSVDYAMLQVLLNKLGKQNLWLRAREVFKHCLSVGYYPGVSAPPGVMTLLVPCRLGEVELALTFEMFITVNATAILHLSEATTVSLSITLRRTQSCESEYLSAGSRLLSAACIPQPKLIIHYKAVNSAQEQVFSLDIPSARFWLRHNHMWAKEVWTH